MFTRALRVPLAADKYSVFFPNIEVHDGVSDDSMNAMFRFLLHERTKERKITAYITPNGSIWELLTLGVENTFYLNGVATSSGDRGRDEFDQEIKRVERSLMDNGYERYDFLREFVRGIINLYAYVDVKLKRSVMFIQNMNLCSYHVAMVMIPKLLPWFFEEHPLNTDEKALLNSILKDKCADVILEKAFQKFMDEHHFAENLSRQKLICIEKEAREQKLRGMRRRIESVREEISSHQRCINDLLRELYQKEEDYESLRSYPEKNTHDLADYISRNKAIKLLDVDETVLRIETKSLFSWYDTDQLERGLSHSGSFWYEYSSLGQEQTKKLLSAIFIEEKYHVRTYANFEIDIHGGCYPLDATEVIDDRIPNTHLGFYNCMGGYSSKINQALEDQDFIEVLELCLSSTSSLNMSDTTVCSKFVRLLTDEYLKLPILEDDQGDLISPYDVIREGD